MSEANEDITLLELKLAFDAYRKATQRQIDGLTKEVQELRELVARNNPEGKPVKQVGFAKHSNAVEMEPLTYGEALSIIGGAEELAKQAERSRQLKDSVNDSRLQMELKTLFSFVSNGRAGFSTSLIHQPYVPDLDTLYSKAESIQDDFSNMLNNLAAKISTCRAIVAPLKSKVRARMKAAFKYRNAADNTISWYRLTDLVRGTLEFRTIEDLYNGLEIVVRHFGDSVKELNDRYQDPLPGGYRDIQTVVEFQGHMCEIQLNTAQMMQAKATTGHRNYSVYRELKSAVKAGDIDRVISAFEFGRHHLGGAAVDSEGDRSGLKELLRGEAATLIHTAAIHGYEKILHAFLLYGADQNIQDKNGNTALHLAVFHGHEPCVWVLTHEGLADLDIKNNDGYTALVRGYVMLWQRPPESSVRAVSTLAQVAGVQRIKEAKNISAAAIRSQLRQSRALVDHAADGNIPKMLEELRGWADPASKNGNGKSALAMAIAGGHRDVVDCLISFRATPNADDMCAAIQHNKQKIWDLLIGKCDLSSLKNERKLVSAAHDSGLQFVQRWLRSLSENIMDISQFGLQPSCNGIFIMQNAYHGMSNYISFTSNEKRLRATYTDVQDAMPIEFIPTGEPDVYKLYNRWPGENQWISFSDKGTWLYAKYTNEADAMPVKFFPTGEDNVYKMKNMWGGQERKWISFTNDGAWIRAIYDMEGDAMPVRLSFKPKL